MCLAMCFALVSIQPAQALTVFDPSNYSQNVLQAARALQQINNQIRSLQNQVLMLQNMAKHLERLDYSSLGAIQAALGRINLLMAQAEGIAFRVDRTEQEFARLCTQQRDAASWLSSLFGGEVTQQVRRPVEVPCEEPGFGEPFRSGFRQHTVDERLVGTVRRSLAPRTGPRLGGGPAV